MDPLGLGDLLAQHQLSISGTVSPPDLAVQKYLSVEQLYVKYVFLT